MRMTHKQNMQRHYRIHRNSVVLSVGKDKNGLGQGFWIIYFFLYLSCDY